MARVLILLDEALDQRHLAEMVGKEHEVVAVAGGARAAVAEAGFDLCLLDLRCFARVRSTLRELRVGQAPLLLPVVLVTSPQESERFAPVRLDEIDEVVTTPVLEAELQARLAALDKTRKLSQLAHAELEQVIASVGSGVCVVDTEGAVLRANPAFLRLVGREGESVVGRSLGQVAGEQASPLLDEAVEEVLSGAEPHTTELQIQAGEDATHCLLEATPFRDLDGNVRGVILSLSDVTTLRQREAELADAIAKLALLQESLVQEERLHALGQMAGGVVHDFNNVLSVILGYADALLRDSEEGEIGLEARKSIETIRTAARDAAYIVKGLRSFYRPRQAKELSLVSVNDVVADVLTLTRPRWRDEARARGVSIGLARDLGRVPRIVADDAELREALTNVVFNAVDAMSGGGTLSVRTRRDGDQALLEITDSGTGMDPEVAHRCFEPFFTTKGDDGTGLGLAMVYGTVQRLGGSAEIDSELGRGTTVRIRLPLPGLEEDLEDDAGEVASRPSAPPEPRRVLVVDDNPGVLEAISGYLLADGHEVETANDAVDALAAFSRGTFEVLITDRSMPDLDGERLAAAVKALRPDTPVIMISGFGADSSGRLIPPVGIDVILQKPVDREELREALSGLFASPSMTP